MERLIGTESGLLVRLSTQISKWKIVNNIDWPYFFPAFVYQHIEKHARRTMGNAKGSKIPKEEEEEERKKRLAGH